MQVVAVIHDENGVYGASFPDFPGCTTVADSADRVIVKAAEVLAFHAEGMAQDGLPLPRIRSLDELRRDPTSARTPRGIIALVPFTPSTGAVRVNITIEESLLARADRAAAAEGETRSGFIATALRERLSGLRSQD
jgi:predicted RNase H-like HicB family nuclease